MKRKIKRQLALVGFAVVAGACTSAYAKGGRISQAGHDYDAAWSVEQFSTLPFDQTRDVAAFSGSLLGSLKEILGGLDYAVGNGVNLARRNGFGLHTFRPAMGLGMSEDPRLNGSYTGFALRIGF